MSKSIALGWVGAGAVLLAILLLMAVSSVFTLHVPVAAQGISPTATTTPALTSAPIPAPVSTAPPDATDDGSQPDGLFYEVDGEPPPSIGVDTLASRLVGIDLGQLAQVNGEVSAVTATLHRPSSVDTIVTLLASPADAVTLSGSGVLTIPAGQTVSGGTVTITGVDNGDQTGGEHPCVSGGAVVDATNTGLVSDCGMLLAARDTLAGTAALNWSADTPIADWTGVALGETSGRVTELDLVGMGLNGRIPTELGSLANLQGLSLWGNQLTGEIPPELGGLSNLEWLLLDGNQLTGEIPPELGGLSNLTYLILWGNQLTGEIPPELGGLSNLTELGLADNQLTGEIPPELGGLSNLTLLWLQGNQLTGEIPPELGGLSNLEWLDLSGNQLTGEIPPELGGLSNLTELDLADNGLTGEIPPELGGLSNLTELVLADNGLTGEIPPELGGLSNLTGLVLSHNGLTGEIPPELGGLSNLTSWFWPTS